MREGSESTCPLSRLHLLSASSTSEFCQQQNTNPSALLRGAHVFLYPTAKSYNEELLWLRGSSARHHYFSDFFAQ